MDTQYIIKLDNFNSTATMILRGDIGSDVNGTQFANELHQLEKQNIKNITVLINSGGGSVFEAYTIFSAILNSTATITTYCEGIAASSAGWIFLAGKNAVMADYGRLMMHNPYSPDNSVIGKKRLAELQSSIGTILAKRSGTSEKKILDMMNVETWITAEQAVKQGFATSVAVTGKLVPLDPEKQSVNVMLAICNSANKNETIMTENEEIVETVNEVEETVEAVEETTNEVEETTEESTEETVEESTEETTNEVEETVEETVEEITNAVEDVVEEKIEVVNKIEVLNAYNRIAELEKELNELKAVEAQRVADEKQKAGTELVSNAIAAGKIKSDASAEWVKLAVDNYNVAKSTLDAINVRVAVDITNGMKPEQKAKMSLREMEVKDPKQVQEIYYNNRAMYNQLYFEQYGVMPK